MKTKKFKVTINALLCSESFSVKFNRKYSLLKVDKNINILYELQIGEGIKQSDLKPLK